MGSQNYGIDPIVATQIAKDVGEIQGMGVETAIVIGGGNIFRGLAASARGMDRATADYMGMLATVINALALQLDGKLLVQGKSMSPENLFRVDAKGAIDGTFVSSYANATYLGLDGSGNVLVYDLTNRRVVANPGDQADQRVHLTIQPRNHNDAASSSASPTAPARSSRLSRARARSHGSIHARKATTSRCFWQTPTRHCSCSPAPTRSRS